MSSSTTPVTGAAEALPVAVVARRLGVSPSTLRTWDRRYGLGPSGRADGGHRRYDADDLERLQHFRTLVHRGVPTGDAARSALTADARRSAGPDGDGGAGDGGEPARTDGDREDADDRGDHGGDPGAPLRAAAAGRRGGSGGGAVLALGEAPPEARGLARAAAALDADAVGALVDGALAERGVVATWEGLLVSVLTAAGRAWQATGEGIEVEHLLSSCVTAALHGVVARHGATDGGRPVVLACTASDLHDLPLVVLSAALAERGVTTRVLGARTPPAALGATVLRVGPCAVVLWSSLPATARAEEVAAVPRTRPPARLMVAGPGWHGVPLADAAGEEPERLTGLAGAVDVLAALPR